MALINCPECNRQISNFAKSCPHCGFPLDNDNFCRGYDVIITHIQGQDNVLRTIRFLRNTKKLGLAEAKKITDTLPQKIFTNISAQNAEKIKNTLIQFGNNIDIIETTSSHDNQEGNANISNYFIAESKPLTCPRCGSTAITTGQRGYSFLTGFLGSNKTVNRCGKCGYSWKP